MVDATVSFATEKLNDFLIEEDNTRLGVKDCVWEVEAWEKIKKAFPDKKNGGRVIITT